MATAGAFYNGNGDIITYIVELYPTGGMTWGTRVTFDDQNKDLQCQIYGQLIAEPADPVGQENFITSLADTLIQEAASPGAPSGASYYYALPGNARSVAEYEATLGEVRKACSWGEAYDPDTSLGIELTGLGDNATSHTEIRDSTGLLIAERDGSAAGSSVETFNGDGSRTVSGYDESGFEIWQYAQDATGAATLSNASGSTVEFDADVTGSFSHAVSNSPQVTFGGGESGAPEATVGFDPANGGTSIQLNNGTSFSTADGSQVSVGSDGSVSIDTMSPGQNSDWGMGRNGDDSGPGPTPAFGEEHPNPLQMRDPLILDLDGDGIELTNVQTSNAHFDYGGTGFSVKTGWAASSEGILVRDIDHNANTVTAAELFGAISGDGFADLAAMDSNQDGKIDSGDANFADLKVWIDADGDGAADAGEVVSLATAGVTAINLNTQASGAINNGNTVIATATFVRSNNTTSAVAEVNFATDTLYARYTPPSNFEYSETAFTLPSLVGYGNVPDLIYSMSLDSDLEDAARDLVMDSGTLSASAFQSRFEAFVQAWAGVAEVDPASRGAGVDARHVALVEAFYGATYAQLNGANASLNGPTLANIETTYHAILDEMMIRFAAQVPLSQLLNGVSLADIGDHPLLPFASIQFNASTDAIDVDVNTLVMKIVEAAPTGATEEVGYYDLMARLIKSLRVDLYHESATELLAAFNTAADETDLSDTMRALLLAELAAVSILDASNTAVGSSLIDAVVIDEGGHTVSGKDGADTYIYLPGLSGVTTIDDASTSTGDKLLLATADPDDVTLSRTGASDDVTIAVSGGGSVTIHNAFIDWYGAIESIAFGDGTVWTVSDIKQLLLDQQSAASSGSVYGFSGDDTLVAGAGGKYLSGLSGNDTYVYASGNGNVTIDDATSVSTAADVLVLTDIDFADVTISRVGTCADLLIAISGSDSILVKNQLGAWDYGTIESFEFADVTLSAADIREIAEGVDASHVTILGTAAAETLVGTSGADVFDGLGGNDILQGGNGTDNYRFGLGSGNDRIEENTEANVNDRAWLVGLLAADVQFARAGNDLAVRILSSGETLTVKDEFAWAWAGVELLQFADGTSWDRTQLREAAWFRGGSGNDSLSGSSEADTLDGEGGNDTLNGWSGGDTYVFRTGSGNDTIAESADSSATDKLRLVGLSVTDVTLTRVGADLVVAINATGEKVTVSGHFYGTFNGIEQIVFDDATTWDRAAIAERAWIRGTGSAETINGTNDADTIDGGGGNDALNGGGSGDTYIFGTGSGNDTISEGASTDAIDTIRLTGLNPTDVTLTRSGQDLIAAINATGEKITAAGHYYGTYNGIEQIAFANGTVWDLAAIQSNAWIRGTSGADTLNGSSLNDTFAGGLGNDVLHSGAGSDTYVYASGDGNDEIDENSGSNVDVDVLKLTNLNPTDVLLTKSGQHMYVDVVSTGARITVDWQFYSSDHWGIEQIQFANGTTWDRAYMAANAAIRGTSGNDSLSGTSGDDLFIGGLGNDTFYTAAGSDVFQYASGDGSDIIDEESGSNTEIDVLRLTDLNPGDITLTKSGLHVMVNITATGHQIRFDEQYWSASANYGVEKIEFANGTSWNRDQIMQNTWQLGTSGNDSLSGWVSFDSIDGGAGNDTISASDGADRIVGGSGNDTLTGGAGNDTFVFGAGFGQDTINDFAAGSGVGDVIEIDDSLLADFATIQAASQQVGNDVQITVDASNSILLKNITLANLHQNDFAFV